MTNNTNNHGISQAQLDAHWMPFTGNREFKKDPRIIVSAQDNYAVGEARIIFMSTYRNDNSILFEVQVREPTIDQRVALLFAKRKQADEYTLKPNMIGSPRSTDGLHNAVAVLGNELVGLHEDSEILKSTVKGQHVSNR